MLKIDSSTLAYWPICQTTKIEAAHGTGSFDMMARSGSKPPVEAAITTMLLMLMLFAAADQVSLVTSVTRKKPIPDGTEHQRR